MPAMYENKKLKKYVSKLKTLGKTKKFFYIWDKHVYRSKKRGYTDGEIKNGYDIYAESKIQKIGEYRKEINGRLLFPDWPYESIVCYRKVPYQWKNNYGIKRCPICGNYDYFVSDNSIVDISIYKQFEINFNICSECKYRLSEKSKQAIYWDFYEGGWISIKTDIPKTKIQKTIYDDWNKKVKKEHILSLWGFEYE